MMPHLKFWDDIFLEAPYLMLGVGIYTFLVSFYGFFISTSGNRGLLIAFAVLLSIACLSQIVSVFMFQKINLQLDDPPEGLDKATQQLRHYGDSRHEDVTSSWDTMQENLHCCGAEDYKDWQPILRNDVPDSCCRDNDVGCGKNAGEWDNGHIIRDIYVDGCFEIMENWMTTYVRPLTDIYSALGAVTAIIELIAIALSSAYSAQITRHRARDERIQLEQRFPTSPGFRSNGQILLGDEYDPKPEYESSRNESEI